MDLFAGFDGGGTKTACVLADETGRILGTGRGGPSNNLYCGNETAAQSMQAALAGAFESAHLPPARLKAAFVSSAAIKMYDGASYVPFCRSCIDVEQIGAEGDIYPVWYEAARGKPCVIVIAGTGSIAYFCRPESYKRIGGWGPQIGDEGSGYDIGLNALRLTMRMYDGRAPRDELFIKTVLEAMQVDEPRALVGAIRKGDTRSCIASVTKSLSGLFYKNNPTALSLFRAAQQELLLLIGAALKADGGLDEVPLALSGSLVQEGRPLYDLLKAEQIPRISNIKTARVHPAVTALALAFEMAGDCAVANKIMEQSEGILL